MEKISRVFDLLAYNKQHFNSEDALAAKANNIWKKYSAENFINIVDEVSRGLLQKGIKKDDKVAIMSENRPEWNFCDFGIMQIGATQVPMYPTLAENDIKFILQDAEVKVIFVSSQDLYQKVKTIKDASDLIFEIYTFDKLAGLPHWSEITDLGKQASDLDLEIHKDSI